MYIIRQEIKAALFGNSRYDKFHSHSFLYSLRNMHLIPYMVDGILEKRMKSFSPLTLNSFYSEIRKRTYGLERRSLCLYEKLENHTTSPKLMLSIIYFGKKTVLTVLWCNATKHLIFETGRITEIRKDTNCSVRNDENVTIECLRLSESMSLHPCSLCSN